MRSDPNPTTRAKDAVEFHFRNEHGLIETWVRGRQRGVSCFASPKAHLQGKGIWWRLPANSWYDDTMLYLYSPDEDHFYWAPAQDMKLLDFERALAPLNDFFIDPT